MLPFPVLYSLFYVPWSVSCSTFLLSFLCSLFCVLCSFPCSVLLFHVRYSKFHVLILRSLFLILCTLYVPCSLFYVLYSLLYFQCSSFYVPCSAFHFPVFLFPVLCPSFRLYAIVLLSQYCIYHGFMPVCWHKIRLTLCVKKLLPRLTREGQSDRQTEFVCSPRPPNAKDGGPPAGQRLTNTLAFPARSSPFWEDISPLSGPLHQECERWKTSFTVSWARIIIGSANSPAVNQKTATAATTRRTKWANALGDTRAGVSSPPCLSD